MKPMPKNSKVKADCMYMIQQFMDVQNPKIKPFGPLIPCGSGYKVWGEKIVNGQNSNNLYYVDLMNIGIWRGYSTGFEMVKKKTISAKYSIKNTKDLKLTQKERLERARIREMYKV